jgi:hypothetical protein
VLLLFVRFMFNVSLNDEQIRIQKETDAVILEVSAVPAFTWGDREITRNPHHILSWLT